MLVIILHRQIYGALLRDLAAPEATTTCALTQTAVNPPWRERFRVRFNCNSFSLQSIRETHTHTNMQIHLHACTPDKRTHTHTCRELNAKFENRKTTQPSSVSWLAFLAARTFAMREMLSDVKVMRDMHARGRSIAGGGVRCQDRP